MAVKLVYVAMGAIMGGIARFTATYFSSELSQHHGFPYGTLFVNAVGPVDHWPGQRHFTACALIWRAKRELNFSRGSLKNSALLRYRYGEDTPS